MKTGEPIHALIEWENCLENTCRRNCIERSCGKCNLPSATQPASQPAKGKQKVSESSFLWIDVRFIGIENVRQVDSILKNLLP